MTQPLVSVVIAAWNAAAYLPETLSSVLAQTYTNIEIVVVDDGSTDETYLSISSFLPQIRYEHRPHRGLAAARNEGIRLATGDYVALLDADDLWHPEKIATQVDVLSRHPDTGLVACDGVEFSGETILRSTLFSESFNATLAATALGEVTKRFELDLIEGGFIACPSQVMIPRGVLETIGPFVDSGSQDLDYYLRVARKYPITLQHQSHARWRNRSDSMSGPEYGRKIRLAFYLLPVLVSHRRRCTPEYRIALDERIHDTKVFLRQSLVVDGRRGGRARASKEVLSHFNARPRQPRALIYLVGVWAPASAHRFLSRVFRVMRKFNRTT